MFDNKDSVAPILVSMFLGLLVVLLIGGILMNFASKAKNKEVSQPSVQIEKNEAAKPESKSMWAKLKEKLSPKKSEKAESKAQTPSPTVTVQENSIVVVPQEETKTFMSYMAMSNVTEIQTEKGSMFTIIMPTNKAFAGVQEALQQLVDRNDTVAMQDLMKRHIIRGKVSGGAVKTLSDEDIIIDFNQKTVAFGNVIAHILEVRGDTIIVDKVLY